MFEKMEEVEVITTVVDTGIFIVVLLLISDDIIDDTLAPLPLPSISRSLLFPMMGVVALQIAKTRTSSSLVLHFLSAVSHTIVAKVVQMSTNNLAETTTALMTVQSTIM